MQAPVFTTREAQTQVMVRDGDTIVIGGLIKEEKYDYEKKVPLLGDIPVLKHLFRKTVERVDTTDLIIFVTVKLFVPAPRESAQQARVASE